MDPALAVATTAAGGGAITAAGRRMPTAPVVACPGWDVAALVLHVGAVHAWAAANLTGDADTPAPFPEPPDGAGCDWADEQRAALLDAFARTDPERPVWAFASRRPASFWWRRQAHETALHAWDAMTAVGQWWDIPPEVAADGVDEVLEVFLPRRFAQKDPQWGTGRTVQLRCPPSQWIVTIDAVPTLERRHGEADLTVEGSPLDVLLWLANRPNVASVAGDAALAAAWAANFKI